jgi:mRNA-degrading endonuclease HigB of HigAB toxin-antitoxin module
MSNSKSAKLHHEDVTQRRRMRLRCMLKQIENGRLKAPNEIKETFEKDNLSNAKEICNKYCV